MAMGWLWGHSMVVLWWLWCRMGAQGDACRANGDGAIYDLTVSSWGGYGVAMGTLRGDVVVIMM